MRMLRRIAIVIAALVLLVTLVLYGGSQWVIARGHEVPLAELRIPRDADSVAEGGRLALVAGCRDCHGAQGQGQVLLDDPLLGRIAPPPLARVAATMSDAELARAIRHGVHKDGGTLFVMPSQAYGFLADEDVARIVAWIRTLKPSANDPGPGMRFGPLGRALVLAGVLPAKANAAILSQPARPADRGRYFADAVCAACHKLHEDGLMEDGKERVPALAPIAAAYDPVAFRRLLRTGVAANGNGDIGMMSKVARGGLHALTDDEIAAIHAYLTAEAARAPAQ